MRNKGGWPTSTARWARLPRDTAVEAERRLAETRAADLGTDPDVVARLQWELDKRLEILRAGGDGDHPAVRHDEHYTALSRELVAHMRATVVRLRDVCWEHTAPGRWWTC